MFESIRDFYSLTRHKTTWVITVTETKVLFVLLPKELRAIKSAGIEPYIELLR